MAPPFVNETIVTGTEVRISWLIEDTHLNITSFRISYEALDHQESVTRVLDGSLRSVTLRHLYPLTKYSFLMVTIADSGLFSNASESVEFTTTADPGKISSPLPQPCQDQAKYRNDPKVIFKLLNIINEPTS